MWFALVGRAGGSPELRGEPTRNASRNVTTSSASRPGVAFGVGCRKPAGRPRRTPARSPRSRAGPGPGHLFCGTKGGDPSLGGVARKIGRSARGQAPDRMRRSAPGRPPGGMGRLCPATELRGAPAVPRAGFLLGLRPVPGEVLRLLPGRNLSRSIFGPLGASWREPNAGFQAGELAGYHSGAGAPWRWIPGP